jgi:hypothetical protein
MTGMNDASLDSRVGLLDHALLLRKPFDSDQLKAAVAELLPHAM